MYVESVSIVGSDPHFFFRYRLLHIIKSNMRVKDMAVKIRAPTAEPTIVGILKSILVDCLVLKLGDCIGESIDCLVVNLGDCIGESVDCLV